MGELGYETDTKKSKRGDGVTTWNALPYLIDTASASSTYVSAAIVAPPTGVSATDCANFAAAHATLPATGGKIVLQRGAYDFTNGVTISKPCVVEGQGGPDYGWPSGFNAATEVVCTSPTATPITKTASVITFRDFGVKYTGSTTPTAGSGVHCVPGSGNADRYENFGISGFYVDHIREGGQEYYQHNFFINDPVKWGESWVMGVGSGPLDFTHTGGNYIAGPVNANPEALIHAEVAGGVKLGMFKMNNRPGGGVYQCGIDLVMKDGSGNEDWLISNASIEGYSVAGIRIRSAGPANTGTLIRTQILGIEFSGAYGVGNSGVKLDPAVAGLVKNVIVDDCIFQSTIPITANNVDKLTVGTNQYMTCPFPYVQTTNCTNVIQSHAAVSGTTAQGVATTETTTTLYPTWADLATAGPAVTVTIGPSRKCLVIISAEIQCTAGGNAYMSYAMSGTYSRPPQYLEGASTTSATFTRVTTMWLLTTTDTLNEGAQTFTAKYCVDAGTGSFRRRTITVIPL
jgi:hypothetical protein